jgi:N-acetylglucosaminyldiphosphoundecaprenol N-acetyl-beta-D-mannosaminyltransferase
MKNSEDKINTLELYGVRFSNISKAEALRFILDFVKKNDKGFVVTPNVDHIVRLEKDGEFKNAYDNASLVLADGMPLVFASKLARNRIIQKISGSDIFLDLIKLTDENDLSLFLLGASEETGIKAKEKLKEAFPKLKIAGRYSPPFGFEKDEIENEKIIEMINRAAPDFLFLFLGTPKQEIWIHQNINKLKVKMAFCVGATLDFYVGNQKRAPVWMQKSGLEWLWRMLSNPKRLVKRYLVDDMFPFLRMTFVEVWRSRKLKNQANKNGL